MHEQGLGLTSLGKAMLLLLYDDVIAMATVLQHWYADTI